MLAHFYLKSTEAPPDTSGTVEDLACQIPIDRLCDLPLDIGYNSQEKKQWEKYLVENSGVTGYK